MYGAPFGKNYTFCEPWFLSLNKLKKHGSQNDFMLPNLNSFLVTSVFFLSLGAQNTHVGTPNKK